MHYQGVFAPNAAWRPRIVDGEAIAARRVEQEAEREAVRLRKRARRGRHRRLVRASCPWAELLERVFGYHELACHQCGQVMRLRGVVTNPWSSAYILSTLGRSAWRGRCSLEPAEAVTLGRRGSLQPECQRSYTRPPTPHTRVYWMPSAQITPPTGTVPLTHTTSRMITGSTKETLAQSPECRRDHVPPAMNSWLARIRGDGSAPFVGAFCLLSAAALPACSDAPAPSEEQNLPDGSLVLRGPDRLGEAGRVVSVADIDADGHSEVLVAAPSTVINGTMEASARAYLLRYPVAPGDLQDVSHAVFLGKERGDYYSDPSALLPGSGYIALWNCLDEVTPVRFYDDSAVGLVAYDQPSAANMYGAWRETPRSGAVTIAPCSGVGLGRGEVCMSFHNVEDLDLAGTTYVMPPPVAGILNWEVDAIAAIEGDPHDEAVMVDGSSDFDGDGFADLVVGALEANQGAGRVRVVPGDVMGYVSLADSATVTFEGAVPGGNLGIAVRAVDLDADGAAEIVAGAALMSPEACVYGLSGQAVGTHPVEEAEWVFCGDPWFGRDVDVGDVDGDGRADVAIGSPGGPGGLDSAAVPGSVEVYSGPLPGRYSAQDATWNFSLGGGTPDSFGSQVATGDVDGDGLADLVIGAPGASDRGASAGAVAVIFGRSL